MNNEVIKDPKKTDPDGLIIINNSNSVKGKTTTAKAATSSTIGKNITKVELSSKPVIRQTSKVENAKNAIKDTVTDVSKSVWRDLIKPGLKNLVYSVLDNALKMTVYGKNGNAPYNNSAFGTGAYVPYNRFSNAGAGSNIGYGPSTATTAYRPARFDYDKIYFRTRMDAEAVFSKLAGAIQQFGIVSVGDFYDIIDMPAPYTAHSYGWSDLSTAMIVNTPEGWCIKFPKTIVL